MSAFFPALEGPAILEISLSFLGFVDGAISLLLSLLISLSSTLYASNRTFSFFGKFDMTVIVWVCNYNATTFGYYYDMVYFCNASYFFSLHTIKSMLQSCLVT